METKQYKMYEPDEVATPRVRPARIANRSESGSQSDPRVQLITLRMRHHAAASGYHRLADVVPARLITAVKPRRFPARAAVKLLSLLTERSGSQWYHRASLLYELSAAASWLRSKNQLFHFLYGENCYRYLGLLKPALSRGNRLMATYHTPEWRLRELIRNTDHIKRLDAAVVVSTTQLGYLSKLIGAERVFYVPHGIDTDFFHPGPPTQSTRGFRYVCVGHHLRDFATLAAAADIIWQNDRSSEIVVVAAPDHLGPLAQLPNVKHCSGISDEHLKRLYQTSDALLLPLLDATANNSLLEAMACGLPVISTELGGVRDYVSAGCSVLTPKADAAALAQAALQARNGAMDLAAMGTASRLAAESFSWGRVAESMLHVYASVQEGAKP